MFKKSLKLSSGSIYLIKRIREVGQVDDVYDSDQEVIENALRFYLESLETIRNGGRIVSF